MKQAFEETLTIEEVAEILEVTTGTLCNWRHRGRGPKYLKIGRRIEYQRESVKEYINGCFVDPVLRKKSEVRTEEIND